MHLLQNIKDGLQEDEALTPWTGGEGTCMVYVSTGHLVVIGSKVIRRTYVKVHDDEHPSKQSALLKPWTRQADVYSGRLSARAGSSMVTALRTTVKLSISFSIVVVVVVVVVLSYLLIWTT